MIPNFFPKYYGFLGHLDATHLPLHIQYGYARRYDGPKSGWEPTEPARAMEFAILLIARISPRSRLWLAVSHRIWILDFGFILDLSIPPWNYPFFFFGHLFPSLGKKLLSLRITNYLLVILDHNVFHQFSKNSEFSHSF
jgi:hypothetical protein